MANGIDFGTAVGLIKGLGSPDPAVIESAVNGWLDDHPEATTTVQDGSITKAKLDSNLQGTVDDVADLKSQISNTAIYPAEGLKTTYEQHKYIHTNGTITDTTANLYVSAPVELAQNESIRISASMPFGFVSVLSKCTSDGTITQNLLSASGDGNVVSKIYTATEETEYVRVCWYDASGYIFDAVTFAPNDAIIQKFIAEYVKKSAYYGMKGVAFGTSLTYRGQAGQTGGYLQFLPSLLGMTFDNQGVGSSFFYGKNDTYQNQYDILYNIQNYDGFSDKNVCIIEGCTNDWWNGRVLGTYKDTTANSVCGCLYNMFSHIYTQNPNIQIIVVLDHYGRNYNGIDMSQSSVKGTYTQYDYYEEIAKCCEYNGIACIKQYATSGIGSFGEQYFYDYIHLNDTIGALQSATSIYDGMIQISPKTTAI